MTQKTQDKASKRTVVVNPQNLQSAELIVGIPSYNEADNIALPTDVVSRGIIQGFPEKRSVIINVDNCSEDGTRQAFLNTPTRVPKVYISTPRGVRGKGNNLKNLFRAAVELKASAVAVVDADLKSITPEWVQHLAEPLFHGYDYVTPIYVRHKYDGTITNHIAYPLLRALYGLRVRQPIGGDFGFSGKLARAFLSEKTWNDRVAHFGIDIWMTTVAIARRFRVSQAFLGTPKVHNPKDPLASLSDMFVQVTSTIFELMVDFEFLWKPIYQSHPSAIYGFGLGNTEPPPEIKINREKLHQSFREGFDAHAGLWEEILPIPEWKQVERLATIENTDCFYYPTALWARILYNYAVAYKVNKIKNDTLLTSLIPFYYSRILSYVNKTLDKGTRESEMYLENISRVFETEKFYLLDRWDGSLNANEKRLFPRPSSANS